MMRAAQARGHEIFVCEQQHLLLERGTVSARALRLSLTDNDEDWYRAHETGAAACEFDAVLMRKDPPFDMEYVASTWLLSQAEREGARVFNTPAAVRDHNEKLAHPEFPQFVAPTLVSRDPQRAARLHRRAPRRDPEAPRRHGRREHLPRARTTTRTATSSSRPWRRCGARSVMAQRYIPEIAEGDKRILLIDGKPVPHCLARIAKPGETRANLAAGGARRRAAALGARPRDRARRSGPCSRRAACCWSAWT